MILSNAVSAIELNTPALSFSLPTINQNTQQIKLADYKGKVIYLDFWASWCAPCRVSFPILNSLQQTYSKQGFEVIAINLDEDLEAAQRFLSAYPVDFTTLRDSTEKTPEDYQIESMPTSFLIDRKGIIRHIHAGFSSTDKIELEKKIQTLLSE